MVGEWKTVRLGNVASTRNGAGIKQDAFSETGIPLARVSDFTDWSIDMSACICVGFEAATRWESHRLKEGEAIVATVGSWPPNWSSVVGKTVRVPRSAVGAIQNQNTCCVLERPTISDQRFLFYLLRSEGFAHYAANSAAGSANQARLPVANLERFEFPLPPLAEQKAIASVMGALDDKIELNRRMNATLEAMARALFQSWFVDFDPVRAKLDGRKPLGLDEATAALFPDAFQDSSLGHIPNGWAAGKLGDIGTNTRRGVQPSDIAPNTPYIALEHMPRRCIALGDWDDSADVASGKSAFKKSEILFGKLRPYFHKVGVAPFDGVCSTDILVLAPKSPEWFSFLLGHVSSEELIQFTDLASTGTKMPRTNWGDISSFKIALPPKSIAASFTRIIHPMLDRIHANLHQSRTLATLRDTLLPKLLSGELSVAALDFAADAVNYSVLSNSSNRGETSP